MNFNQLHIQYISEHIYQNIYQNVSEYIKNKKGILVEAYHVQKN